MEDVKPPRLSKKVTKFKWEDFKKYVNTYDPDKYSTPPETVFEDMLYGLGLAIEPKKFKWAQGYRLFKQWLANRVS